MAKPAIELLEKYRQGSCTAEEIQLIENWFLEHSAGDQSSLDVEDIIKAKSDMWAVVERATLQPSNVKALWPRIAAAAAILLLLSAGSYFLLHKPEVQQIAQIQKQDITPGRNQATLTLANGRKIVLTKSLNGNLAQQGNTAIQVNAGTALTYISKGINSSAGQMQYNTLSTTRGEQSPYVLILGDGTKVWLNAASSITYPVAFNGKDRQVKITGEAYFEVVHNAAHPFKVTVKGQTIEDIGTTFNINAYDDEPVIKTTLVSGSIKVANKDQSALLKPGQVAITHANQSKIQINNIDTEGVVAWKNGYFLFDRENLESIMRKVSRWYNVDIQFSSDQCKKSAYWGSITRYTNVSKVLKMLEETGHEHFSIADQKIIVTEK